MLIDVCGAHSDGDVWMCGADSGRHAPFGAPPPSLLRMIMRGEGSESKGLCCCGGKQTSDAERVARTGFYFVIASEAKQSRYWAAKVWIASSRSLSSAGHFGPDPLAPRNDEVWSASRE